MTNPIKPDAQQHSSAIPLNDDPNDTSLVGVFETYFRTNYPTEVPSESVLLKKVIPDWKDNYPRLPTSKELEIVIKKVYYPKLQQLEDVAAQKAHAAQVAEEKLQKKLRGSIIVTRRSTVFTKAEDLAARKPTTTNTAATAVVSSATASATAVTTAATTKTAAVTPLAYKTVELHETIDADEFVRDAFGDGETDHVFRRRETTLGKDEDNVESDVTIAVLSDRPSRTPSPDIPDTTG